MMAALQISLVAAIGMFGGPGAIAAQEPAVELIADAATPPERFEFEESTPLAEGVSPKAVLGLETLIEELVERQDVVGAEVLVIKNGRSILHRGFGLSNLEDEVPMGTGNLFCVRSMTKPFIGTAILMLVDDKVLKLDDTAATFLPAFDVDDKRDITIEQLLTHTTGLPMSELIGKDLKSVGSIADVAQLGASAELLFEPGTEFHYSDQGTDTLTAIIEVVTGAPPEEFIHARILEPLGMRDSATFLTEDHPVRELAIPLYIGTPGLWRRFWAPDEATFFPCFLGSQGLYATLEDYARFMEFWRRGGRNAEERLLGKRFVRKALKPGPHPMKYGTGFPDASGEYGFQMQIWRAPDDEGEMETIAFGHNGSDGTHAWVFPKQDAMAFFFTQSRGTTTGLQVEEALARMFLGAPYDPNDAAPPLEQYLGYYWEGEGDTYRAIVRDEEDLALEILGRGVVTLQYAGDDRWRIRENPSEVLDFQRDDAGVVTGYRIGDHEEFRFTPSASLPTVEDLAARVRDKHRVHLMEELGVARVKSSLSMPKLGMEGEVETFLAWPGRYRVNIAVADQFERKAFDGETVRSETSVEELRELEGEVARFARLEHWFARFGDWDAWHPEMHVIQRLLKHKDDGGDPDEVFLVRAGGLDAPGRTYYVHSTGVVFREDSLTIVDMAGRMGQRVNFGDFREIDGMYLPFAMEIELPHPLIGTIEARIESIEFGVEVDDAVFSLSD